MNCFDCNLAGTDRPAVAICHRCNAAICAEHAVVVEHRLGTGGPVSVPRRSVHTARLLECTVCHRAEDELAGPPASGWHHHTETTPT